MAEKASTDVRSPLVGGCLCGSVAYSISFPAGAKWPPDSHTCQCPQCRRQTGSLVAPFILVHPSRVTWDHASDPPTLSEYNSSGTATRGFCKKCGSPLFWRDSCLPDEIEIFLGSVDKKFLVGKQGEELCRPTGGEFWFKCAIKGVTDLGPGYGGKGRLMEGTGSAKAL